MSKWPIRKIYLYSVCLISIIFILVALFSAVDSFVTAIFPYDYGPAPVVEPAPDAKDQSEQNARRIAEEQERYRLAQMRANQQRDLGRGIGKIASALFIALPIFMFHWRQTRPDD